MRVFTHRRAKYASGLRSIDSVFSIGMKKHDNTTPRIIFESEDYVVIDKPAGLDSQNSKESRYSVVDWLKKEFKFPGLVHRLDLNTSGLMVCAKNEKTARYLSEKMVEGKIKRGYLAVVIGKIESKGGQITTPLEEKNAVTHYTVLENYPNATLVEVDLETGRKHQIRRHFSMEGHPLLGDHLYKKAGSHLLFKRPALHAHRLQIEEKKFETLLPEDFLILVTRLRGLKSKNL